jgi:hypothetical protein
MTSTPTHRVIKVLSAGDFSYQVNDLVDASQWATLHSLVSTDYLVPLTKAEIEELTAEAEVETEPAPVAKKAPAKKAPAKKTTAVKKQASK